MGKIRYPSGCLVMEEIYNRALSELPTVRLSCHRKASKVPGQNGIAIIDWVAMSPVFALREIVAGVFVRVFFEDG